MADDANAGLFNWVDSGLKTIIALMIPAVGLYVDNSIKLQTKAIDKQNTAFTQALETRQKDVDLTLKFYDVIGSKRFECFDESQGPLLRFIIETNNSYNKVQLEYPDIASSLIKNSVADKECKAGKDAQAAKDRNGGEIPEISSADGDQKKLDGWVSLGRYQSAHGYPNFEVLGDATRDHASVPANTVIRAKTAVYLRANNSDILLGKNQILAVLAEGACATVKASVLLRGHVWAEIDVPSACPEKKQTEARM